MKHIYILTILIVLSINTLCSQNNNFLNFDGTNDYVSTTLPSVFTDISNNDITIEASIFNQSSSFSRILFAQLTSINFMSVSLSPDNRIIFYVNNTIGKKTASNSIPLNQWIHFAVIWISSTQEIQIYLNGVLQTIFDAGNSTASSDNLMTIGSKTDEAQFYKGNIDELRIWNVVRTQSEISTNMNNELTLPQTNLVSYYKFNQGIAGADNTGITTLNDEFNTNNGTLNNFTLNGNVSNWLGGQTLGTQELGYLNLHVKLFPNPTTEYIQISGIKNMENYSIYNVNGSEISTGSISIYEKIDVRNYSNGLYFLKFENGNTIKFMKE